MKNFYLIGIGGAGMSVVAQLLAEEGYGVSGSDKADGERLEHLRNQGITCYVGHRAEQVPADATVVISTAVRDSNPELAHARQLGLPVWHRSQALAFAAQNHDFIAVAGAHGKTTTSAMLATALAGCDLDPSFAVGGVINDYGTGAHLGKGKFFIAEADESDASFLNYRSRLAIVTNVEPDHLDHYHTQQAFEQAFVDFVDNIEPGGAAVLGTDDVGARRLAAKVAGKIRVISYGFEPFTRSDVHVQLSATKLTANGAQARLTCTGVWRHQLTLDLNVTGAHNLMNAAAAWAAGVDLGADPEQLAMSLRSFRGTGRRFQLVGEVGGVRVFDDYAHHPTEVVAALEQARTVAGNGRVLVVFQPHLFSRTQNFADRFAKALDRADIAVVCDIYAAREDPIPGVDSQLITHQMRSGRFIGDRFEAGSFLVCQARPGDLILTVGAGDITQVAPRIVAELGERL